MNGSINTKCVVSFLLIIKSNTVCEKKCDNFFLFFFLFVKEILITVNYYALMCVIQDILHFSHSLDNYSGFSIMLQVKSGLIELNYGRDI